MKFLETAFLTVDQVKKMHRRELENHGGQEGLRDAGALESSVNMARQSFGGESLATLLHNLYIKENQENP